MELTVSDEATIAEVLGGNSAQYRVIVEKYHHNIIGYLYNMTRDSTQAEDLAQETFVQAFRRLSTFDSQYSFSTWIYTIASNIAKKYLVKQSRTFQVLDGENAPSAEDFLEEVSRAKDVRTAISTLKPDYQQVINLFYWEDKSYNEIATIVGCPVGTVRTWLSRSKQELEERLYGHI